MTRENGDLSAKGASPRIACLAWGSLIWDPGSLPIKGSWLEDGPCVKVEFLRQSGSGCLTLVLHDTGTVVRSMWALMDATDTESAREQLGIRERCYKNWQRDIHAWRLGDAAPTLISDLEQWAKERDIHAVIWTGLSPKKDKNGQVPTVEDALKFLVGLPPEDRAKAEEYIRKAPLHVITPYRRQIEAKLNWMPNSSQKF